MSAATIWKGERDPARGLTESQTDEQFNAQLEASIEQIYQASVHKQPATP